MICILYQSPVFTIKTLNNSECLVLTCSWAIMKLTYGSATPSSGRVMLLQHWPWLAVLVPHNFWARISGELKSGLHQLICNITYIHCICLDTLAVIYQNLHTTNVLLYWPHFRYFLPLLSYFLLLSGSDTLQNSWKTVFDSGINWPAEVLPSLGWESLLWPSLQV